MPRRNKKFTRRVEGKTEDSTGAASLTDLMDQMFLGGGDDDRAGSSLAKSMEEEGTKKRSSLADDLKTSGSATTLKNDDERAAAGDKDGSTSQRGGHRFRGGNGGGGGFRGGARGSGSSGDGVRGSRGGGGSRGSLNRGRQDGFGSGGGQDSSGSRGGQHSLGSRRGQGGTGFRGGQRGTRFRGGEHDSGSRGSQRGGGGGRHFGATSAGSELLSLGGSSSLSSFGAAGGGYRGFGAAVVFPGTVAGFSDAFGAVQDYLDDFGPVAGYPDLEADDDDLAGFASSAPRFPSSSTNPGSSANVFKKIGNVIHVADRRGIGNLLNYSPEEVSHLVFGEGYDGPGYCGKPQDFLALLQAVPNTLKLKSLTFKGFWDWSGITALQLYQSVSTTHMYNLESLVLPTKGKCPERIGYALCEDDAGIGLRTLECPPEFFEGELATPYALSLFIPSVKTLKVSETTVGVLQKLVNVDWNLERLELGKYRVTDPQFARGVPLEQVAMRFGSGSGTQVNFDFPVWDYRNGAPAEPLMLSGMLGMYGWTSKMSGYGGGRGGWNDYDF